MAHDAPLIDVEQTVQLCTALRGAAELMTQRQRRKGHEYRFREPLRRPVISAEIGTAPPEPPPQRRASTGGGGGEPPAGDAAALPTAGERRAPPGSGPPARGGAAAGASAVGATAAARGRPGGAAGAAAAPLGGLADYDPQAQARREHDALLGEVTSLREEASALKHSAEEGERELTHLELSLAAVKNECDLEAEQEAGVVAMTRALAGTAGLEAQLREAEAYSRTLGFMAARYASDQLANQATLRAFEDALRVHAHELELQEALLRTVKKSREAELGELARVRGNVASQLHALDGKLEARRHEVKARQDKARWRLAKAQEEAALKAQAEGDLSEAQERTMIDKAKNLTTEATELRNEKMRVQSLADQAEATFHRVRFAAGVSAAAAAATSTGAGCAAASTSAARSSSSPTASKGSGGADRPHAAPAGSSSGEAASSSSSSSSSTAAVATAGSGGDCGGSATADYAPPDAAPVIARFCGLAQERAHLEERVGDYAERLHGLTAQRAELAAELPPPAGHGEGGCGEGEEEGEGGLCPPTATRAASGSWRVGDEGGAAATAAAAPPTWAAASASSSSSSSSESNATVGGGDGHEPAGARWGGGGSGEAQSGTLDLAGIDGLRARAEASRRTREAVHREATKVALLRLQLEQCVSVLAERLGALTVMPERPPTAAPLPGLLDDADRSVSALLRKVYVGLPSAWCACMHERIAGVVSRLQELMRHTHADEACEAFLHSSQWLAANVLQAAGPALRQQPTTDDALPPLDSPAPEFIIGGHAAAFAAATPLPTGGSAAMSGDAAAGSGAGNAAAPPRKLIPSLGHRQASARIIMLERQSSTRLVGAPPPPPATTNAIANAAAATAAAAGSRQPGGGHGGARAQGAAGGAFSAKPPVPGATILGEMPESPLLARKAPLDERTRALDAEFDATIEQLMSSNAHVVRVRPGSGAAHAGGGGGGGGGGGPMLPPHQHQQQQQQASKPVTRKAIADAATAFERSWTEGPAPEEAEAAERAFATLHAKLAAEARASEADPFSRDSSLQRRRGSRSDIQAALQAAATALSGLDADEEEEVMARAGGWPASPAPGSGAPKLWAGGGGGGGSPPGGDGAAPPSLTTLTASLLRRGSAAMSVASGGATAAAAAAAAARGAAGCASSLLLTAPTAAAAITITTRGGGGGGQPPPSPLRLLGAGGGGRTSSLASIGPTPGGAADGAAAAAASAKPRARDLQRFLAAAVQMAGDEVEEGLVAPRKDNDDLPTRDKMKRATKVVQRQMRGATGGAAAGGAGGRAAAAPE